MFILIHNRRPCLKYALRIIGALVLTIFSLTGCADSAGRATSAPTSLQDYWYDGNRQKTVWRAQDEIVLFSGSALTDADAAALGRAFSPAASVVQRSGRMVHLKLSADVGADALSKTMDRLKQAGHIQRAGLVYYGSPSKQPQTRLILGNDIIVQFSGTVTADQISDLEKAFHLRRKSSLKFAPNTFVYSVSDLDAVLATANRLYESGKTVYAYPDWIKTRVKKSSKQP